MSQTTHHVSNNFPGYAPLDGRCLPCSGISGRAVAVSPCSSRADHRVYSQVNIGSSKCVSRGVSYVCKAMSGGHRRDPDFSRQNRHGFRGRKRQNEDRDSFEGLQESEMLSSKNGPLLSLSNSLKFQAIAAPGPRETEIVELFRKVQAQLRERAAVKEDKKIEASQGQGKASETVDSLLKLLKKHSVEQGKRKGSSTSSLDFNSYQSEKNGEYSEDKSMSFFDSRSNVKDEAQEHKPSSLARPASNFRRMLPVRQVKFQSISSEHTVNSVSHSDSSAKREKNPVELHPEPEYDSEPAPELELESEPEPEVELEPQSIYQDGDIVDEVVLDEVSDNVSSDLDDADNDEDENEQDQTEHGDLSALKLPELRALAKSRGMKGFSKMKKGVLVELPSVSFLINDVGRSKNKGPYTF